MKTKLTTFAVGASIATMAALTSGCNDSHSNSTVELTQNEQKVVELLNSIETGAPEPIAYINPENYTQHNLAVKDGLAGFGETLAALPEGGASVSVKRVFEYGEFVVAHTEYDFFGPKAGFDIFRFENNLIVEHWDNLQDIAPVNASGRSQFDGTTTIEDINDTDSNIAIVQEFIDTVFISGEGDITQFIGTAKGDYLQHNPAVADDLDGLSAALTGLAAAGTPMIYTQNHAIMGKGNFVLAVSEGEFLAQHVAYYDLFRLKDGMIVEHWDTIETIPAESEWANSNGKFGFN